MRRYLLRIRPGKETWPLVVEPPPRSVYQWSMGHTDYRPIPYVLVNPQRRFVGDGTDRTVPRHVWERNEHFRKAEVGLLELARQVAAANPTRWVDVLDVTDRDSDRIVCRLEPAALAPPVQDSLL